MASYNIYPIVPSAPPEVTHHLNILQSEQQELKRLEERYKEKYKKYTNILERLTCLNACSSSLSVATGISGMATFSTFIGLPVSIPLGVASLTGMIASAIMSALTKKYQKKLTKVTTLTDIITPALAIFDMIIPKALKNGKINKKEFNVLQTFHLKTFNELTGINCKMEQKAETNWKKTYLKR